MQLHDVSGADVGTVHFVDRRDGVQVRATSTSTPRPRQRTATTASTCTPTTTPQNGEGCVADPAAAPATWFTSVDGHWRTAGQSHAAHLGDLASVYVTSDGTAEAEFTTQRFHAADLAGRRSSSTPGQTTSATCRSGRRATTTRRTPPMRRRRLPTRATPGSHRLRCGGVMRRAVRLILLGVLCGAGWGVAARGGCA